MNRRLENVASMIVSTLLFVAAISCDRGDSARDTASSESAPQAEAIPGAPGAKASPIHAVAEFVRLSPEQLAAAGIEIAAAGPGAVDIGTELVGEVHPNGDRLAHITPRFPGIVREVLKNAGDPVRAGDILAVIESSDSLAPYSMKTAIDGVVIAKDLTRGEAVERTKQAFVVADLTSVWVDLAVYQKDLGRIAIGRRVHIDAVGEGPAAEGRISYVTPSVDQVTRTATARVVLANPERRFLPGMFVTAHTLDSADALVAVSREAIQTLADRPCVFVEQSGGLVRRPIVIGRQGSELVEVVSGLSAGERIAIKNSFLLKAELAKGEGSEDE